ncbi:MAG: CDP-glucose 4,6-dehydratase [Niveispirillum sp.]|uniref:CDP-glucose 4,6-dehydratase n=1 Tax=Niveispirillum sp. TaxID=1917217 RepID=UPI003BA83DDB
MSVAFWGGRRVLVTGHTGFKGGWLSLWLKQLGAVVAGYSLPQPTEPGLFTVADVGRALDRHVVGDVRDLPALESAIRDFRPEIVFHLAAQPIVLDSYRDPVDTYATNVMGTANLLEAVRRVGGVQATVIVTSDKCYENREQIWAYREHDAMGGHDPYSSSKGAAELVAAAFGRSFFYPGAGLGAVASARAGNVIGGGDWAPHRLAVDLMRGLMAGEKVVIRNPGAVRPWQHVLEPLSGYLLVARCLIEGGEQPWEGWNFGPDDASAQPVLTVASRLCALWGAPEALTVAGDGQKPHEAGLLKLDSAKARVRLGWSPTWDLEKTLARTVDWYKAFSAGGDMWQVTNQQIDEYENALSLRFSI